RSVYYALSPFLLHPSTPTDFYTLSLHDALPICIDVVHELDAEPLPVLIEHARNRTERVVQITIVEVLNHVSKVSNEFNISDPRHDVLLLILVCILSTCSQADLFVS